jgi:hemerythrin-like domain-containing protein
MRSEGPLLSAIEMLENEHKLIMRTVKLLPTIQQRVEHGDRIPEALMTVIDFFQVYADKSHHAKEEDALFPLLAKRGVRVNGCPIGTLHSEHEQGRILMTALSDAIQRLTNGDTSAKAQVVQYLKAATAFYTDHIWKEDYLLFPMAHKVLNESDEDELRKQFVNLNSKFGSHFQEEYHYRIDRLKAVLRDGGKIQHPWGPHTKQEGSSRKRSILEESLRV